MASLESLCSLTHLPVRSFLIAIVVLSCSHQFSLGHQLQGAGGGLGRKGLLIFKETPQGGNTTFECSPAGPCVPCQYSEKNDEKYRCSETGYRIPLKCQKNGYVTKETNKREPTNTRSVLEGSYSNANAHLIVHDAGNFISAVNHRTLLDNGSKGEPSEYISYRSCIPAVNEERLSVLGFEVFTLGLLLISGSVIFFKRKMIAAPMPGTGGVRIQTNSRY
ncbi:hypothetical protein Nepgr_017189 [Nepenthes gracilis]|uniref:TNFR-Cys domain-containing protein n=1 Tax=Nepenthes gracilis TaxID=150966 RepID=A0AAD3SNZ7_NEPGR|nr:hypothetical protein Nepgr_017189 [Nepenthes gracilis]